MMQDSHAPVIGLGTWVRKPPFFNSMRRGGCKAYTVYNRMYMPVYCENPVADYRRLVNDVTLWDVVAERQVEITGPDAVQG